MSTKAQKLFKIIEQEMGTPAPTWVVGMRFDECSLPSGEEVLAATLLISPQMLAIKRSGAHPHKREIAHQHIADFFGRLALTNWPTVRYLRKYA